MRSLTPCPLGPGASVQFAQIPTRSAGAPFSPSTGGPARARGRPPPLRFACHAAKWQFRRTCRRMKDSPCRAKSMAPRGLAPRIFRVLAERSDQQSYETSGRHFLHDTFITAWVGGQRGSSGYEYRPASPALLRALLAFPLALLLALSALKACVYQGKPRRLHRISPDLRS